jgi:hypothetical protein
MENKSENKIQAAIIPTIHARKRSYWITIEGDVETEVNESFKFKVSKQKLPHLRNIRDLLEALHNSSKIEYYVCAFEKGDSNVISVNLVYFGCAALQGVSIK